MHSVRSIVAVMLLLACLAGVVPTWADELPAPELDLDETTMLRLTELAEMFGQDHPEFAMLTVLAAIVPEHEAVDSMVTSLELIQQAIELSGIDTDFTAPPTPTGDELFDRYALIVDEQLNATTLGDAFELAEAAVVPDEVLAQWEPEFGDDPRYWELRYLMAMMDDAIFPIVPTNTGDFVPAQIDTGPDAEPDVDAEEALASLRPVDYLLEAERRGCASANTLLLLHNEIRQENEDRLEELTTYEGATGLSRWTKDPAMPPRPEFSDETIAAVLKLQAAAEDREAGILEAACFRGHGEAWPRYMRGFNYLSLGEFERGMRDLKQGNTAQINSYPVPFPVKLCEDTLLTGKPAGGPAVNGAVQMMLIYYPLPNYIKVKELVKNGFVAAELGAGFDTYETWHKFACRYGESRQAVLIQSMVATVLVGMLKHEFVENHTTELSAAELDALIRITDATDLLKNNSRLSNRSYDEITCTLTLGLAGGTRGLAVSYYLFLANDARAVHDGLLPVFDDLADFSYYLLHTPASMEHYEPIPHELYLVRRECRNAAFTTNQAFNAAMEQWNEREGTE